MIDLGSGKETIRRVVKSPLIHLAIHFTKVRSHRSGLLAPSKKEDYLVSKTYMTRVEGENTRLRHYLARLHRKTLCYSKSLVFLRYSIRLLSHYLRFDTVPSFS